MFYVFIITVRAHIDDYVHYVLVCAGLVPG